MDHSAPWASYFLPSNPNISYNHLLLNYIEDFSDSVNCRSYKDVPATLSTEGTRVHLWTEVLFSLPELHGDPLRLSEIWVARLSWSHPEQHPLPTRTQPSDSRDQPLHLSEIWVTRPSWSLFTLFQHTFFTKTQPSNSRITLKNISVTSAVDWITKIHSIIEEEIVIFG